MDRNVLKFGEKEEPTKKKAKKKKKVVKPLSAEELAALPLMQCKGLATAHLHQRRWTFFFIVIIIIFFFFLLPLLLVLFCPAAAPASRATFTQRLRISATLKVGEGRRRRRASGLQRARFAAAAPQPA